MREGYRQPASGRRPPVPDTATRTWPARSALILLLHIEAFFVVMIFGEAINGNTNIPMLLNSTGLVVFCGLALGKIPWSRWVVPVLLLWRVVTLLVNMILHIGPNDHRFAGSILMLVVYLLIGAVIASPFGRLERRSAADGKAGASD